MVTAVDTSYDSSLPSLQRIRMMGAEFGVVTEHETAASIVEAAAAGHGNWTITANLDHLRRFQCEPLVRDLLKEADLLVADGVPLVWASRLAGMPLPERVAGSSLIWSICELAGRRGVSVFLIGGNPGAADVAAGILESRYRGLEIAGTLCPSFGFERHAEEGVLIERQLKEASPDIVLVGLGFPKQDTLIRRLRPVLPNTSFIGVGVAFSFVAGEFSRGPGWMGKMGFEWLFRLAQEPRRLAERYLLHGLPFALHLFLSAVAHRLLPKQGRAAWQAASKP